MKPLVKRTPKLHHLRGWTFVETIVGIAIVVILTSSVGFMAFRYLDQAKTATAKSQVETLAMALNSYRLDTGSFPTQEAGLGVLWSKPAGVETWNGPYVAKDIPKDPWDRDYQFRVPGPNDLPFEIVSWGADGKEGGTGQDADISSAK